jgi:hypothetical protein
MSAIVPATIGVLKEVPFARENPDVVVGLRTKTDWPGAVRSGLSLPSAVGPLELKSVSAPSESSAPTAMTESPSAGVLNER